jgi:lysozyme family protein
MADQAGQTPAVANAPVPEAGTSWSDNLTKGLQDPAKVGLLGMGLSMMATPPRPVKYSGAEIIGNAGLHGLKFFQQAVDDKRKADMMAQTAEEHKLTREDQRVYRQGTLEDRAVQREIQRQNAVSLEEIRKASGAAKTGKLVPVKQADGSVAYERMLDAVGQEVPQKPERLVPVRQADGSVTYAPASEAAGQAVPQKSTQKYKNVPGVGMVDISGDKPKVVIPTPVLGRGGRGAGGRPTANIQNIEYLVGNGWNRKEAENMILQGKRMPRETFIANMTKSIYGNEFIDDADKANKMQEAIKFYDSTIPQRGGEKKAAATGKVLDQATATSILQEAGGDKDKARKLAKERGFVF